MWYQVFSVLFPTANMSETTLIGPPRYPTRSANSQKVLTYLELGRSFMQCLAELYAVTDPQERFT